MAARAFFAGRVEWAALAEKRVPPPHEPTILGAADTRNFWHACLDEPDAERIGAALAAADGALPEPDAAADAPATAEAQPAPGSGGKRARCGDDEASARVDWWDGF